MSSPLIPTFAHRSAEYGVDSICRRCFVTVATVEEESDLELFERQHVCDPEILDRYAGRPMILVDFGKWRLL